MTGFYHIVIFSYSEASGTRYLLKYHLLTNNATYKYAPLVLGQPAAGNAAGNIPVPASQASVHPVTIPFSKFEPSSPTAQSLRGEHRSGQPISQFVDQLG
jgi:hypothetical protein